MIVWGELTYPDGTTPYANSVVLIKPVTVAPLSTEVDLTGQLTVTTDNNGVFVTNLPYLPNNGFYIVRKPDRLKVKIQVPNVAAPQVPDNIVPVPGLTIYGYNFTDLRVYLPLQPGVEVNIGGEPVA